MENQMLEILKNIQSEITSIKDDVSSMKVQLDENTQILRALEHSSEVNKSEHDKIVNELAHIKGDIKEIKKDLLEVEVATANNWSDIATLKSVKLSQN